MLKGLLIIQKFNGLVIISDIDGTLIENVNAISFKNLAAIRYFCDNGGLFTLATGRSVVSAKKYLKAIDSKLPAIFRNGFQIYSYHNDKILYTSESQIYPINIIQYVLENMPQVGIEIYNNCNMYVVRSNERVVRHLSKNNREFTVAEIDDVPLPWSNINFVCDPASLKTLDKKVRTLGCAEKYEVCISSPEFLEMLPKGVTKGAGLLRLSSLLSVPLCNMISIGDSENDISMLEIAGVGVAVGNAIDSVKAAADYVVADASNHSIHDLVDKIDSQKIVLSCPKRKNANIPIQIPR